MFALDHAQVLLLRQNHRLLQLLNQRSPLQLRHRRPLKRTMYNKHITKNNNNINILKTTTISIKRINLSINTTIPSKRISITTTIPSKRINISINTTIPIPTKRISINTTIPSKSITINNIILKRKKLTMKMIIRISIANT